MRFFSGLVPFALRIWATAGIAFKRLLTQRFLSLASIAGLMIAPGFILSVTLSGEALRTVTLPILQVIRRFNTDSYHMFPHRNLEEPSPQYWLTPASFAFI